MIFKKAEQISCFINLLLQTLGLMSFLSSQRKERRRGGEEEQSCINIQLLWDFPGVLDVKHDIWSF